ncbi:MAG TPA: heterodisulfide reductase-related iron-sulfur binding cluster [Polyangiaceae bacterium]|nr:heterodisulfide reductase-related iron-sulfur binding cluster [Polyangiaceae bacterium]
MADRKLIDDCVHCGFCLPTCPTYQSWGEEMDSPRGRIYLMKSLAEGTSPLSATVVHHFDQCLGCMGCVTACPSGVKYDALIEQTRAEIERSSARPRADRLFRAMIFALFPYVRRLKLLMFVQWLYIQTGMRWLLHRLGVPRLLPRRLRNLETMMPPVSMSQLVDRLPAFSAAEGTRRTKVALLAGCVQRAYFPEVNEATLRVLTAEGCEVLVPRDLHCCGALSVHSGRADEARGFARAAIAALERADVDAVVVNAAGCGSSMKEWGRLLADDTEWAARAEAMAKKTKDVSEFLTELGAVAPRHPLALKIAYHDACHLAHAQRIREQPRALLRAIPGVELTEIADADQCCGSAGIYNLVEPESARQIGARKVDNVLAASPELLVSANPGCTLQIQMLLRERGQSVHTAHPIELLDASIRGITLRAR